MPHHSDHTQLIAYIDSATTSTQGNKEACRAHNFSFLSEPAKLSNWNIFPPRTDESNGHLEATDQEASRDPKMTDPFKRPLKHLGKQEFNETCGALKWREPERPESTRINYTKTRV